MKEKRHMVQGSEEKKTVINLSSIQKRQGSCVTMISLGMTERCRQKMA